MLRTLQKLLEINGGCAVTFPAEADPVHCCTVWFRAEVWWFNGKPSDLYSLVLSFVPLRTPLTAPNISGLHLACLLPTVLHRRYAGGTTGACPRQGLCWEPAWRGMCPAVASCCSTVPLPQSAWPGACHPTAAPSSDGWWDLTLTAPQYWYNFLIIVLSNTVIEH